MKVNHRTVDDRQQGVLFDPQHLVGSMGRARYIIGRVVEELSAERLNGVRHLTDSRCEYCPDVTADGRFYECKAVGKSNQLFVYKGRLEKDSVFDQHHDFSYIIWKHNFSVETQLTVTELENGIRQSIQAVYIVPFRTIRNALLSKPLVKLNSNYGGGKKEVYGSGYRCALSEFEEYRNEQTALDLG